MYTFVKSIYLKPKALLSFLLVFIFYSCTKINLYEKVTAIPGHKWKSSYRPQFRFTITDTTAPYQLFVILRHNEKYNYNNIWLNLYTKVPGDARPTKATYELRLATNEKGWLGTGMDDIYEHRIALTPTSENFYFRKAGEYIFTIEHIMREDPLENIMNVGLRVERKQP